MIKKNESDRRLKKNNIMIVEDSPTQAERLKYVLEQNSFSVITASNGKEALGLLQTRTPDVVITDITMPEMDGYQLCRKIKSNSNFKDIPVILLTVLSDPRDILKGLQCGADNFITKPYDDNFLVTKIQSVLANEKNLHDEKNNGQMEILFSGQKYSISSNRVQILNMLLSSYELAVQKNLEMIAAKDSINEQLEEKVQERTTLLTEEVAERKRAEEQIKRLYEFQTAIREINQNLLRVKSEPALFQTVCDLLARLKDIRFVWIGLWEKGVSRIKPSSYAGVEDNYLELLKTNYMDFESGICPINSNTKVHQPVVINDIESSNSFTPHLKEEALKRKYASSIALAVVHEEEIVGILCLYAGKKDVFGDEEVVFLEEVANDIAVGIKSLRLGKKVEDGYKQVKETLGGTIDVISLIGELRDSYTAGHQRRVSQLACAIAGKMGFEQERIEGIRIAGLLHDIGKIAIPSDILNKPGKLTKAEMDIIKSHPNNGYKILEGIKFAWPVAKTVLQHHERIDGSGYTSGLSGDDIIIEAKILSVADVVEAMSSHRPYRPALGIGKALEEINAKSGIIYDPAVVDACLKVFRGGFVFE